MNLLDILRIAYPRFDEADCKVHLAVTNPSGDDPMKEFFSGEFKKWQEIQTRKNFEKSYVLSLIQLSEKRNHWLFAGIYKTSGCNTFEENNLLRYRYSTQQLEDKMSLVGRLVVNFERTSRQSYLIFENWKDKFQVSELLAKPVAVFDFPGHENVRISKKELDLIVSQGIDSWRGGLNYPGIYLITDLKTGRLYVGKAGGENGIWQRWSTYSKTGHGGNVDLVRLLEEKGAEYANNFQFSILEIALSQLDDYINKRESHWKKVLASGIHGHNKN